MSEEPNDGPNDAGTITSSVLSTMPIGKALQTMVTALVADQRIERLEGFFQRLSDELVAVKCSLDQLKKPENIELIEDGAYQAVRAFTEDRKRYIAKVVAKGIADDDESKLGKRRILKILSDLDDQEILILEAYGSDHVQSRLQEVRPPPPAMSSPPDVRERSALFEWAHNRLHRLDLLRVHPGRRPGREFTELTSLGRAVLRTLDLLPPGGIQDRMDGS
ncbi:hypothetical protein [Bradyrhizobium sp. JR3.5]